MKFLFGFMTQILDEKAVILDSLKEKCNHRSSTKPPVLWRQRTTTDKGKCEDSKHQYLS